MKALLAMLDGQSILIKNPHLVPARMQVNVTLPKFLVGRGWTAVLDNPGAGAFGLKSGEIKPVVLRLKPGKDFVPQDVIKAEADTLIEVVAQADGIVVGGMGYGLDPTLVSRLPTGLTPATRRTRTQESAPNNAPIRKAATRKTK